MLIPIFLAAVAQAVPEPVAAEPGHKDAEIVVTASLIPTPIAEAPSVTVFDEARIEALGAVLALDLIRLSPGVSVSVAGAQGSQAQLRIRGAEANHSLVFIDGIAFNDLAANNEARFETFTADGLGRLEIIRGPQSALFGSEALGGVVAMSSPDPLGEPRGAAGIEYGSRDFMRGSLGMASGGGRSGVSATASWARSEGIDILGGGNGDRDGFENFTASVKGVARPGADSEVGIVGRYIHHHSEFDGQNAEFQRADTADAAAAQTYAARAWGRIGIGDDAPWSLKVEGQYLASDNRNRVGRVPSNDSEGRRTRFGAQALRRIDAGGGRHALIAAVEREDEDFATRDLLFGGGSDRDLERGRTAFVGEWRAHWGTRLVTDIAVRHDDFSRFEDATSLRANAVVNVTPGFAFFGSYGEGIAQPSFIDLFGFGPGSGFVGNPALTPEKSRGFEAGARWRRPAASLEAVAFSNALTDEIVEDFSAFPTYTVVNAPGKSPRRGVELSGEWRPAPGLRLSANYTYTDTRQREVAGADGLREIRRPKHTANLAGDWRSGALTLGGYIAYVGKLTDRDFDLFPAPIVSLDDYVLASFRIGYRLAGGFELFGRVENAGGADYQDVIGYNTAGRAVHAGLRLHFGD